MTATINIQRLREGFATRAFGFFLTGSAQNLYTNVVFPGTHHSTCYPVPLPLIVHSLFSRFITDNLLRDGHYAVLTARIKQSGTKMDFAERLHDMARRCGNGL